MFKDITIGQYYPENSIVHRLDPRVKLFGVVVYVAAVFIINNLIGFIFLTAAIATLIALSKVPLKHILKGLRFVWFLVILAVFFNLFFSTAISKPIIEKNIVITHIIISITYPYCNWSPLVFCV